MTAGKRSLKHLPPTGECMYCLRNYAQEFKMRDLGLENEREWGFARRKKKKLRSRPGEQECKFPGKGRATKEPATLVACWRGSRAGIRARFSK